MGTNPATADDDCDLGIDDIISMVSQFVASKYVAHIMDAEKGKSCRHHLKHKFLHEALFM